MRRRSGLWKEARSLTTFLILTTHRVRGAIAGYLLIAILFAFAYA